ncbi:MAG TPA: ABC transporter ATP-binding protein, partial [Arcobacter skirrowii]|nr:ABC transporter ATP-binding protein [Aliarcobacter skirrowii]
MLELKNYSNFILKDISFLLKNNENLLILGENGAGKSTLAKVLSSIISSNNLFFNEKNISKLS